MISCRLLYFERKLGRLEPSTELGSCFRDDTVMLSTIGNRISITVSDRSRRLVVLLSLAVGFYLFASPQPREASGTFEWNTSSLATIYVPENSFPGDQLDDDARRSPYDLSASAPLSHWSAPWTSSPRTAFTAMMAKVPIRVNVRDGGWVVDQAPAGMWDRTYTCRSGRRCTASTSNDRDERSQADILLTLEENPSWISDSDADQAFNRTRTRTAFLGMEAWYYDVDTDNTFDFKATVYQPETEQDMWITYSETPASEYFDPPAQLDWATKSRDRAVVFVSSNTCPDHRNTFVHELIKRGVDVW